MAHRWLCRARARRWRGGRGRADMRPETRDLQGRHETLRPPVGGPRSVAAAKVSMSHVSDRLNVSLSQCLRKSQVSGLLSSLRPRAISKKHIFRCRIFRLKPAGEWDILISVLPPKGEATDYPRGWSASNRSRRRVWAASRESVGNLNEKDATKKHCLRAVRLLRCFLSGSSYAPHAKHRGRCLCFHHRPDV